jgi:hypothetical protein
MQTTTGKAMEISGAVGAYLRAKYGMGDKTWHPLFTACRELFCFLMEEPHA